MFRNYVVLDVILSSNLCDVKRTGWLARKVPYDLCESVLDHTLNTAKAASLYNSDFTDMALVHDLAEEDKTVGDITPFQGISKSEKFRLEYDAIRRKSFELGGSLGNYITTLWDEYSAKKTEKALICSELCKFDALLNAINYEKLGYSKVTNFYDYTRNLLTDPLLIFLFEKIMEDHLSIENPHQYYFDLLRANKK